MNIDTQRFVQKSMTRYYQEAELPMPPRFGRREWGFFQWKGRGMIRPVAFNRREELRAFLVSRAPRHVYFSTAYYKDPAVPMAEKEWLGADLIFDLDADHLPGADEMTFKSMLAQVKVEFVKLVDKYILGDMGFDEKDVNIVFSGGRGYHIHVRDPKVLQLNSQARREIVDYVTGSGLEFENFLEKEIIVLKHKEYRGNIPTKEAWRLPPPGGMGWAGRMNDSARMLGERLKNDLDEGLQKKVVKEISSYPGIGKTSAEKVVKLLGEPWGGHESRLHALLEGDPKVVDSWEDKRLTDAFLEMAKREVAVSGAETDEPVTSDVKRLIRMPGSLHGKSALRVIEMSRSDLDDFEPLRDAPVFGDEPVKLDVTREITCFVGGEKKYTEGTHEAPGSAAMFMMCNGAAELHIEDGK